MDRLREKVALVSGASRGIGLAIAQALLAEGARVVLGDVLDAEGQQRAQELGPHATYVHLDVTSPTDWAAAVQTALSQYGQLHVLVNNAGIADKTLITESTAETTSLADWDRVLAVNLTGPFLGMQQVLPLLKAQGGGSIINVSSVAALLGSGGPFAYTASKGGLRSMTKHVAVHYGRYHVRANSIHPGGVNTAMTTSGEANAEQTKAIAALIPLGRLAEPAEIAQLTVFLASDESSYLTGAEIVIDGGLTVL